MALIAEDGTLLASLRGPGASQEDYPSTGRWRISTGWCGGSPRRPEFRGLPRCPAHVERVAAGCDLPAEEESLTAAVRAQGWSATAVATNDTSRYCALA